MYLVQSRINPGFNRSGQYFPFGVDKEVPDSLMTPEILNEPLLWVREAEDTPFLRTDNDIAQEQYADCFSDEPRVQKIVRGAGRPKIAAATKKPTTRRPRKPRAQKVA